MDEKLDGEAALDGHVGGGHEEMNGRKKVRVKLYIVIYSRASQLKKGKLSITGKYILGRSRGT